ncbi:lytic murein transglycosylase [Fodinibius halophilus]|uniref:Transglycosylase SLT domain-containing protein n=1 Tax=Fodinibius halophilus TaxID=1736908 RepID=A0A6M1TJS5_9BACT|nr:lytic murein transglycosylase [Fodinibius halophilus]NGP88850.1 hypothetical protein [Fodinibius halophilus]
MRLSSKQSSLLTIILLIFLWIILFVFSAAAGNNYSTNTENSKFVSPYHSLEDPTEEKESLQPLIAFLKKEGYEIEELLADSRFELYDGIADRFRKSAERKSHTLESYKRILGFDAKAREIRNFINKHSDQLDKASQEYGISKYVISAIIGIESDFGQNIGSYNPFNAYVSMYAENYRRDFAKAQLKELMEFVARNNIDVFELKSSYAGAMTFAQFIPYSLNKWFVGKDLFDMDNNIMSVANYLAYFKKRTNSIRTAVLRYNPSSLYTKAVLDLADTAEKRYGTR